MLATPKSPLTGRASSSSGRASTATGPISPTTPTHIMSTRSTRARANAISEHSPPSIPIATSRNDLGNAQTEDGEDDADDEGDDSGDANAPSGIPARGRRAGRPRKTPMTAPKPTYGSSPTIDELLRDQDYHMVDYEDFEDSVSVIERFALDDIGQDLGLDISSDLDPGVQHILSGDMTGIQHSNEGPFSDSHMGPSTQPVCDLIDAKPSPEPRRRHTFVHDPDRDDFANFRDLTGPYPSLQDETALREAHTRLRLTTHGFQTSSFPGTPLTRRRCGSLSNYDAGYETDENPLPGSATLRPSALHQSRTDIAPLSPYSASTYITRHRRRGPPMGSFKTHRRQAHAMLDDDGETLLIYPATAPGHDCKVSKVIENMASGTFQISNITAPIAIEVPVHSIEDHGDDKDALRTLAQQGANLLEESFSNFAHLGVLSPPAEPLADTEPMDEYEAMACIDSFIDFGSDDDDEGVPESMDTSALATQITSPVFSNEATFAPSTDYVAETSNTQGLVDGFHNDLIGAFRSDSDIIAQNPYSSAFEDDSLTSPLFPSQSSVLSPNKRRCESIAEDEETEQRPEKRAHIGSGIEVFGSKY